LDYSVDAKGRPGRYETCTCNGHFALGGGPLQCQKVAGTYMPLRINTAGTANCVVVLGKLGNGGSVLNLTGNNVLNLEILDGPTCPVSGANGLDPQSLTACDGVPLEHFNLQTNKGQLFASVVVSEPACVASLKNVQVGQ